MPKILLVEDDNNLREIFQMRLEAEGYKTLTAADGEEGLVVAMKEKPDLMIADVMMPKLSGFEMLENLRSTPEMKDTKVIMMTALGQAEDQARGEKLGVIKYLVKSQVTLEDFARVVKDVLGPGDPAGVTAAKQSDNQSNNNQQEGKPMQQDTPSTNPAPAGGDMPAGGAPSDPAANPMSDGSAQSTSQEQGVVQDQINNFANSGPAPAPAGGDMPAGGAPSDPAANPMGDGSAQSTSQEQGVVQDQINNFANSGPAPAPAGGDMPAGGAPSDPAAPASGSSDMGAPAMPPATDAPAAPAGGDTAAPAGGDMPSSTPPSTPPTDPTSNAL